MRNPQLLFGFASLRRWQTLRLQPRFGNPVEASHPHVNELLRLYRPGGDLTTKTHLQLSYNWRCVIR